ncbi:unnamed protein product [Kuraishia capsulata CBS 1993]|uniref:Coatomer subunit beta n=1 Tax=Kuraishia capsulata CBS 1993 TaxID=1382522 RepID=W6MLF2_9ASCO|nr:uncharacterized protein KUCA_T00001602001 [Kuraishia capsulata CBS 1993]CDK25632.1 unnamed protein product [Kuraishia capsulata CBS 1993]
MTDVAYTLISEPNTAGKPSQQDFKSLLEKSKDDIKIDAMKQILISMVNGDSMPDLLMHVIRYVMPSKNKELKKLLYFYWEVCPKLDSDGKLKQEMILVCNAIQHDLQHPNEYIRGNTLRFLSKLKEPDLLEPLVPSCRQCLEHRHAYVRKNAAFAVFAIHQVSEHLIPDAAELIASFLAVETDSTCKRNAFICLGRLDREQALRYIQDNLPLISALDPLLQMAFMEFIRQDALQAPDLNTQYLHIISELLDSSSNTVIYEAATTLTILSNSQPVVTSAASKFIDLAIKEPDSNVKLIALERVTDLHKKNPGMLDDMCLEILRILSAQAMDVRKKALDLTLELVSSRNVEDVVKLLKKELQKTASSNEEKTSEYRQLLISAIHTCAIKFAEVAAGVVDLLLEFMGELNSTAATDVITFVKEVVEKYPELRSSIVQRLVASLKNVTSGKVYRGSLWIIGEYCTDEKDIQDAWRHIRSSIGEVPILASERRAQNNGEEVEEESKENGHHGPVVLPDGTYATESALSTVTATASKTSQQTPLRALILQGDFYLAAVLSSTLVKLILRFSKTSSNTNILNALKAEAMLIMVSILRVGESNVAKKQIDEDSSERIFSCVKFLSEEQKDEKLVESAFLEDTREAFRAQLDLEEKKKAEKDALDLQQTAQQADDVIVFRQFAKDTSTDVVAEDLALAANSSIKPPSLSSKLTKITQLTGFSDPVYAEAFVQVHQFDVVLDVLLVNQTTDTLKNLSVEFATLGDLKVVDKPTTHNIGPHGFHRIQTTIKVSSADTGVIFGNIVYEGHHANDNTIVILSDVHVDIMDYINPANCTEATFRKLWNEFEWENKITIKYCHMPTLKDYLDTLLKGTNMNCLTPGAVIGEECQFLSANLYARSSFGEDALANLCIEKTADDRIVGHVRIRTKGQGLALSMGDRVAAIVRKSDKPPVAAV